MPDDRMSASAGGEVTHGITSSGSGSKPSPDADVLRLIAFGLGPEWYALETSRVRGVEPEPEITPVPRAPEWLLGVFNLRGTILPAVDPRPILGIAQRHPDGKGLLIVFQWNGNAAALLVDAVDEMYEIPRSSLELEPAVSERERPELIPGHVRVRDHVISVLDVDAFVKALMGE